jgi:uncharacterized protein
MAMTDPVQGSQAVNVPKEALTWGALCHLAVLAVLIGPMLMNVLGPLVVWLLKKNDHPFIDEQGKESLNFQISMTIYSLAAVISIIGIPLAIIIGIADIVLIIVASIKTSNGENYRYPLTIRFIK